MPASSTMNTMPTRVRKSLSSLSRKTSLLSLMATFCLAQAVGERTIEGRNGIALPAPPPTAIETVTDNLHGTEIADPYRWLEDARSPKTRAWITSQIKYTEDYLSQVKIRPQIVSDLTKLQRVDVYSVPSEYGGRIFFEKRLADENQSSIYLRDGWWGKTFAWSTQRSLAQTRTLQ